MYNKHKQMTEYLYVILHSKYVNAVDIRKIHIHSVAIGFCTGGSKECRKTVAEVPKNWCTCLRLYILSPNVLLINKTYSKPTKLNKTRLRSLYQGTLSPLIFFLYIIFGLYISRQRTGHTVHKIKKKSHIQWEANDSLLKHIWIL